ncbi:MAG: hypothetical protein QXR02_06680 [Acidilobaceae archaeon]
MSEAEDRKVEVKGRGRRPINPIITCPKCWESGSLYSVKTGSNTYYYVYHGKTSEGKIRRCYLGPTDYKYVSKLHDFTLQGSHQVNRYIEYLEDIVESLTEKASEEKDKDKVVEALKQAMKVIADAIKSIEK